MQLIDKSYYDYDFKDVEKPETKEQITIEATAKSEEETHNILAAFGWKPKAKQETRSANDMSVDELQQMAINEINKRKKDK